VAWEYRVPTSDVERWPWAAFFDALSTITEVRFGLLRNKAERHNQAASDFKNSLPR
jgi:hypothetical protein